jgi:hypothetical protein
VSRWAIRRGFICLPCSRCSEINVRSGAMCQSDVQDEPMSELAIALLECILIAASTDVRYVERISAVSLSVSGRQL